MNGRLRPLWHRLRPFTCPHGWYYPPARTAACSVCPRIGGTLEQFPIVDRARPLPDRLVGTIVVTGAAAGAGLFVAGWALLDRTVGWARTALARRRGWR